MQYFKHSEITDTYKVSLKTVHNWIDAGKQGKIALQLHKEKGRTYILKTSDNVLILKRLSEKGRKYRNSLHHKVIKPTSDFYKIYDRRQILDIITSLDVHGEIPRKYNYFEDGATNWDNWLQRLAKDETHNLLKGSIQLMHENLSAFDRHLQGFDKVNVIDLGIGNAYPARELLGHLINKGTLNRYIGIDISERMLHIARQNVEEWYGDKVNFEGYIRDISFEHFDDLLVEDMLGQESTKTINLVLLLGATPTNFRSFEDVFKAVYNSVSSKDLLVYTDKPDTENSRRYFDFNASGVSKLSPNHKYILDLLNIDESLYDAEMGYDEHQKMRYVRVKINTPITIDFSFDNSERSVQLEKGDTILLLRVYHFTALEIISTCENAGFSLLQSSLTQDRQYFLSISGVEIKTN